MFPYIYSKDGNVYQLTEEEVLLNNDVLEEDDLWYYICSYDQGEGVVLLDLSGEEFNPNLDHIKGSPTEEQLEEFKTRLAEQEKVELSIKNGEWKQRHKSQTEQYDYGVITERWSYWEHPEYGKTSNEKLELPSRYNAQRWLDSQVSSNQTDLIMQAWFEAWVDLRFG